MIKIIDVSDLITDSDFANRYTVMRSRGEWIDGRFEIKEDKRLNYYGVVQQASDKEIEQLDIGDNVNHILKFFTTPNRKLYITNDNPNDNEEDYISDVILYKGDKYKIIKISNWENNGYYRAYTIRVAGDSYC